MKYAYCRFLLLQRIYLRRYTPMLSNFLPILRLRNRRLMPYMESWTPVLVSLMWSVSYNVRGWSGPFDRRQSIFTSPIRWLYVVMTAWRTRICTVLFSNWEYYGHKDYKVRHQLGPNSILCMIIRTRTCLLVFDSRPDRILTELDRPPKVYYMERYTRG